MSELADKERRAIKILRMYRGDDPTCALGRGCGARSTIRTRSAADYSVCVFKVN